MARGDVRVAVDDVLADVDKRDHGCRGENAKQFPYIFCGTEYITSALWALYVPELALQLVHLQLVVHVLHLATVLGEAANSQ